MEFLYLYQTLRMLIYHHDFTIQIFASIAVLWIFAFL